MVNTDSTKQQHVITATSMINYSLNIINKV